MQCSMSTFLQPWCSMGRNRCRLRKGTEGLSAGNVATGTNLRSKQDCVCAGLGCWLALSTRARMTSFRPGQRLPAVTTAILVLCSSSSVAAAWPAGSWQGRGRESCPSSGKPPFGGSPAHPASACLGLEVDGGAWSGAQCKAWRGVGKISVLRALEGSHTAPKRS